MKTAQGSLKELETHLILAQLLEYKITTWRSDYSRAVSPSGECCARSSEAFNAQER